MRIAGQIPHDVFTITVFTANDKYLIKLEAGPMEQTYKVSMDSVSGLEGIRALLDQQFLEEARTLHNQMFMNLKTGMERFQNK